MMRKEDEQIHPDEAFLGWADCYIQALNSLGSNEREQFVKSKREVVASRVYQEILRSSKNIKELEVLLGLCFGMSVENAIGANRPESSEPVFSGSERLAAELVVKILDVPEEKLHAPNQRPNEDSLFRIVRYKMSEHLNVSLEYRPLGTINAIFVARKGYRQIALNQNNNPESDLQSCLHPLGHLALGHVDESVLVVRLDGPGLKSNNMQEEEIAAEQWAKKTELYLKLLYTK